MRLLRRKSAGAGEKGRKDLCPGRGQPDSRIRRGRTELAALWDGAESRRGCKGRGIYDSSWKEGNPGVWLYFHDARGCGGGDFQAGFIWSFRKPSSGLYPVPGGMYYWREYPGEPLPLEGERGQAGEPQREF